MLILTDSSLKYAVDICVEKKTKVIIVTQDELTLKDVSVRLDSLIHFSNSLFKKLGVLPAYIDYVCENRSSIALRVATDTARGYRANTVIVQQEIFGTPEVNSIFHPIEVLDDYEARKMRAKKNESHGGQEMKMKIKKMSDSATIPTRGSDQAAGYDLYACLESSELVIPPHCTKLVKTGIAVEIPNGYFGGLYPRSGIALKKGLRPGNCVGVIDSDYRGEIGVALHNDTDISQTIHSSERIAQLIIQPYVVMEFEVVNELSDTERGSGGFGHTGK